MADIFVSHASADAELVSELVQLIEGGIGIRSAQIFCTSLEEQGIPPGLDFKAHIKKQLGEAKAVIAVVSPQYYNSAFCMCELGATWALTKDFIPVLVPPVDYDDLRGSLFGTQALRIDQDEKLDAMHSVIVRLAQHPEKVVRWNSRKSSFLQRLPEILKRLKPVSITSEKEVNKLKARLSEYRDSFHAADEEIQNLNRQIAELSNLKDTTRVQEIKNKYSKGSERFNELVDDARKSTRPLPRVVCEALFHYFRDEDFVPDYDTWHEEAQSALEQKLLKQDENVFSVNQTHPKVRNAINSLSELAKFLRKPPSDFSVPDYEEKYQDILSLTNRTFWQRHHLF